MPKRMHLAMVLTMHVVVVNLHVVELLVVVVDITTTINLILTTKIVLITLVVGVALHVPLLSLRREVSHQSKTSMQGKIRPTIEVRCLVNDIPSRFLCFTLL